MKPKEPSQETVEARLFLAGAGMNRLINLASDLCDPGPRRPGGRLLTTITIIATVLFSERQSDRVRGQLGTGHPPTGHDGHAWRVRTTKDLGFAARAACHSN